MEIFSLKIGGQAGQGIKSAGLMLAKVATRSGYNIYTYTEYPSLIRGGHNVMQICINKDAVTAPTQHTDFLVALNQETIDKHLSELIQGSAVLFDGSDGLDVSKIPQGVNVFSVPLSELATQSGGSNIMINTVALGATVALLGGNLEILSSLIKESFEESVAAINLKAAQVGFDHCQTQHKDKILNILTPITGAEVKMIVNGNEAIAMGAMQAGLQFAAIYPMTPTSNILSVLAENQEEYNFIYKQPEDEISAINMAIGASFAGARSMVATSGGGFCLMTEGYGLAAAIETPLVVIEGMRPGPATGMPTWSDQGDLQMLLHAAQGEFPRIVFASGDAKEAFDLTKEAFEISDKYQTPVIVVVDKNICEGDQSFPVFESTSEIDRGKLTLEKVENFQRFAPSPDGVSQRSIPGTGNFFIANSDEHNSYGYSSEEISDRKQQMEKRMSKLTGLVKDLPQPTLVGNPNAEITIVSWGSNKGNILQAIKNFDNVNFLQIKYLSPFPQETVKEILGGAKHILDIESNFSGQLAEIIRQKTGIEITDKLLKYDGRPIYPEEIIAKINSILQK